MHAWFGLVVVVAACSGREAGLDRGHAGSGGSRATSCPDPQDGPLVRLPDAGAATVAEVSPDGLRLDTGGATLDVPWPGGLPDHAFAQGESVQFEQLDGAAARSVSGAGAVIVFVTYGPALGEAVPSLAVPGLPALETVVACDAPAAAGAGRDCRHVGRDRVHDVVARWEGEEVRLSPGEQARVGPWDLWYRFGYTRGGASCTSVTLDAAVVLQVGALRLR